MAKLALKQAKKNPQLYTESELQYMHIQLRLAKDGLERKRKDRRREKGFAQD
mgnify:CR=1 FL=1